MKLVPFYTMFAPVVGKDLAELLADGCSYSLPVAVERAGRLFDALFLYKPELGARARPTGWILMDSASGNLAVLADCEVMDFVVPDLLPPEAAQESYLKNQTPKKISQMRAKINDLYDEIREFAYSDTLNESQAAIIEEYKDLFLKMSLPEHYAFYFALSPNYFHWLRLPLPTHKISKKLDESRVLEDSGQTLILENLQQLVRQFQDKIKEDAHKRELFDEMHAELQEYKNGLLDQLTLSIELDVIKMIDDVERSVAVFSDKQESSENYSKLYAVLAGVATDLEDLMYRHGVEPYIEEGDKVNIQRQKILSTTPTNDVTLDKKIAKRLARGWEKQGKIIRPERISAYLYQEDK